MKVFLLSARYLFARELPFQLSPSDILQLEIDKMEYFHRSEFEFSNYRGITPFRSLLR